MEISYGAKIPRRRERELRSELRRLVAITVPDAKIKFVCPHILIGHVHVTINLEAKEEPTTDLLPLISPVVDRIATLENEAGCTINKQGGQMMSSWSRWALPKKASPTA